MATAVYETMAPKAQDPLQVLLVKAAYYLQAAAEAASVTTPSAMYENMTPFATDTLQVLTAKLAYWAAQISSGGGAVTGVTNLALGGATPPSDGSVATKFVFDTDNNFLWYNSGSVASPTWNNV